MVTIGDVGESYGMSGIKTSQVSARQEESKMCTFATASWLTLLVVK